MAVAGGCPLELDGNIVLLKTPQAAAAKHRETVLELSWKFPSCSKAFLVLEITLQQVGEKSQRWPFPQLWTLKQTVANGESCLVKGTENKRLSRTES